MTPLQKTLLENPNFDDSKHPIIRRIAEMIDSNFVDASPTEVNIMRVCMLINIVIFIGICFSETIIGWFK